MKRLFCIRQLVAANAGIGVEVHSRRRADKNERTHGRENKNLMKKLMLLCFCLNNIQNYDDSKEVWRKNLNLSKE